ncbi:tetratricopeptide repeat protein [Spirosoma sp. KNUC1025]|uniref:tetratricopeptide repeat protein n=1 Tax=Spirosoma sp. KNUC1025 TaxID=2894082 RepID=UPI00386C9EE9|nr:tetratricopeptide repeat protein [Spirosoma sp. KNUC1025]
MMKTDLETIENYLAGKLSPVERTQFESVLNTDPEVADAVAFYLLTRQAAQDQVREREQRRAELDELRTQNIPVRSPRSVPMSWAAAASVILLLGLGWLFFRPTDSAVVADRLVDEYVTEHFMELPTTMGGEGVDSLTIGAEQFNKGKLAEAEALFERIATRQPENENALKYAGIVSLRQGNYDKAITFFHRLSQQTDLVANPGTFYEALALLKRGQPLDKSQAKKLLEDVINKNLDGKQEAERLISGIE